MPVTSAAKRREPPRHDPVVARPAPIVPIGVDGREVSQMHLAGAVNQIADRIGNNALETRLRAWDYGAEAARRLPVDPVTYSLWLEDRRRRHDALLRSLWLIVQKRRTDQFTVAYYDDFMCDVAGSGVTAAVDLPAARCTTGVTTGGTSRIYYTPTYTYEAPGRKSFLVTHYAHLNSGTITYLLIKDGEAEGSGTGLTEGAKTTVATALATSLKVKITLTNTAGGVSPVLYWFALFASDL